MLKKLEKNFKFHQSYYYYFGVGGKKGQQSSGAYIFRPNDTSPVGFGKPIRVEFVKGKSFQEVRQVFSPWVSQKIRLDTDSDYVEFQFLIGPIPKESKDPVAKEVISRFNITGIDSGKTFFTDSNGRQMMKRTLDSSPTYNRENTEPIASNFYPVTTTILVKDNSHQMTVLTDRSQAGGSFGSGNIDLMIHRRCFHDDNFGVDEALDEPGKDGRGLVISGSHYIQVGRISSDYRQKMEEIYNEPLLAFTPIQNAQPFNSDRLTSFNGMTNELPKQIKVLTLKLLQTDKVLLRLENFYQKRDSQGSVQIDLTNLFVNFEVQTINEVSMARNKIIAEILMEDAQKIELQPMQIRTFELGVKFV